MVLQRWFPLAPSLAIALMCIPSLGIAGPETPHTPPSGGRIDAPPPPSFVWVDPIKDLAPDAVAQEHISNILFVNRCLGGCTVTPGLNDSRVNTSTIPARTSTLAAFPWGDEAWDDTIKCIKEVYAPYDVNVVTDDPGDNVFHHEAILAGKYTDLGLQQPAGGEIGGIAPAQCTPLNNVISFSFAESSLARNGSPIHMCWTVAQESAHAFGLPNHVFHCSDPMTYIEGGCGQKFFRNQQLPCGETEVKACNCSGSSQNSHTELLGVFGKGEDLPPPELTILFPAEGAEVDDEFSIFWSATDERLVANSEVRINGTKYEDLPGNPFETANANYETLAPSLPDGIIDIEIRSENQVGSVATAKITVQKGAPCANDDSCFDFQTCSEGRCEYPPAEAGIGDSCEVTPQCLEGFCADIGGDKTCSVVCNPSVPSSCAEDFECLADSSGGNACSPKGDTGGCCSVAGTKGDPIPWMASLFFLFGILVLRRRS